jgi:zinc transporter ZupT
MIRNALRHTVFTEVLAVIVILVAVLVMSVFKPSGWGPIPGYVLTAASAVLLVVLYRLIYKRW